MTEPMYVRTNGRPVYRAGQVPDDLATRRQLRRQGLSHAGLTPAGEVYLMLYHQYVDLFRIADARPVRPLTPRQRDALAAGRELRANVDCPGGCGARVSRWAKGEERWCWPCGAARRQAAAERRRKFFTDHRTKAAEWAAAVLADPTAVVLDTETTGLYGAYAVEISVLEVATEQLLLDTLLHPGCPIPAEASHIHGITDDMVTAAPQFADIAGRLGAVLAGRRVVIYNAEFDMGVLRNDAARHPAAAVWLGQVRAECAMEEYARWFGDWSDWHRSFTWQPLRGGHRAAGDCRAVIARLTEMAATVLVG